MKILLYGGLNKLIPFDDPRYNISGYGNWMLVQRMGEIQSILQSNKSFGIVTTAKKDGSYYDKLNELGLLNTHGIELIEENSNPDWNDYGGIAMLGGNTERLMGWLHVKNFKISQLSNCEVLMGDSAGSYVLGGKVMIRDNTQGTDIEFIDGHLPESRMLVVGHTNNPNYYSPELQREIFDYCDVQNISLCTLTENNCIEANFENGEFRIVREGGMNEFEII